MMRAYFIYISCSVRHTYTHSRNSNSPASRLARLVLASTAGGRSRCHLTEMASSPDPSADPAVSWSVIGHIVDRVACTVHTHGHLLPRPEPSPATVGEQMQEVLMAALNGRAALDAGTTHLAHAPPSPIISTVVHGRTLHSVPLPQHLTPSRAQWTPAHAPTSSSSS